MSSTGSGYDYSCGTFSPDGRIFQVEYAQKAVENSGTAIGLKCSDGIVLIVEKPQVSKMLVAGSNRRIFNVDSHVGLAITGFSADGRQIVHRARDEAKDYFEFYGQKIVPLVLINRLGLYVHHFTRHGSLRPFGASALMASYDEDTKKPELYMVEPSGLALRYFGCSVGKGAQAAKTELEKVIVKFGEDGINCRQAIKELARILHTIRDPSKDKPFEIEIGWLCEESKFEFSLVPSALVTEADEASRILVPTTAAAAQESKESEATEEIQPMEI